jgi:hypothetical protein
MPATPTPTPAPKTPWHLWVVGALSLLWNLGGAFDFFMTQTKNAAYLKAATPAQVEFCQSLPSWVVILWGIATWGAPLGSLLLLLRKRQAVGVFLTSLVAMVLMTLHNYGFTNIRQVMPGTGPVLFTGVIFIVALLLWIYARKMCRRGVLK